MGSHQWAVALFPGFFLSEEELQELLTLQILSAKERLEDFERVIWARQKLRQMEEERLSEQACRLQQHRDQLAKAVRQCQAQEVQRRSEAEHRRTLVLERMRAKSAAIGSPTPQSLKESPRVIIVFGRTIGMGRFHRKRR